jgi:hypothetical protein
MNRMPVLLKKAIVIPIHKKGGIKHQENYRGISLLNSGYNINASIIKIKLTEHYNDKIGEEQNIFQRGRSCCDGYFPLKIIIEEHREFNIETHLAFIDYKKAFHKVNRNKLIEIITQNSIPSQLNTAICEMYKHNLIAVTLQAETLEWKIINCGVRQVCSLSPLLFIIYMNKIIQKWKVTRHGNIPITRNVNIDTMFFADDQVLLAKSEHDLQY